MTIAFLINEYFRPWSLDAFFFIAALTIDALIGIAAINFFFPGV